MPWSAQFVDPIILPDGRKLKTLRDAAAYPSRREQNIAESAAGVMTPHDLIEGRNADMTLANHNPQ